MYQGHPESIGAKYQAQNGRTKYVSLKHLQVHQADDLKVKL